MLGEPGIASLEQEGRNRFLVVSEKQLTDYDGRNMYEIWVHPSL